MAKKITSNTDYTALAKQLASEAGSNNVSRKAIMAVAASLSLPLPEVYRNLLPKSAQVPGERGVYSLTALIEGTAKVKPVKAKVKKAVAKKVAKKASKKVISIADEINAELNAQDIDEANDLDPDFQDELPAEDLPAKEQEYDFGDVDLPTIDEEIFAELSGEEEFLADFDGDIVQIDG
jgi:hypothetical protein